MTGALTPFSGTIWRIMSADMPDPLAAAGHPEGRFHHGGQRALYASLSRDGAGVAVARYLHADPRPRVIVPLQAVLARVADIRGETRASVAWQDIRKGGGASPTWTWSDYARAAGAQAMLYSSRSRPDLAHIVLFDWAGAGALTVQAPPAPWP